MLSISDFIGKLRKLTRIQSKTGRATYSQIEVIGDVIRFKRDSTGNYRKLKVSELYNIYRNLDYINTNNVKPYIQGWKYSPACAILIAIKIYNPQGVRV